MGGLREALHDCVNRPGNCACPLTEAVIACLFEYFAWLKWRLTPEVCRLTQTAPGLIKTPQSASCSLVRSSETAQVVPVLRQLSQQVAS